MTSTTKDQTPKPSPIRQLRLNEHEQIVSNLDEIARQLGTTPSQVVARIVLGYGQTLVDSEAPGATQLALLKLDGNTHTSSHKNLPAPTITSPNGRPGG